MTTPNVPVAARGEKRLAPSETRGPSIYFAAPKSQRDTRRYQQLVARAQALFPDARVIEGLTAFRDTAHWRAAWPTLLASVSALVFIADGDGWIGRGVWLEVQHAHGRIPVYFLTDGAQLVPLAGVTCTTPQADNWTSHVRVSVGLEA